MYDEVLTVRRPIISICSIPPSDLSIPAFEAQAANKEAIKIYVDSQYR